MRFLIGSGRNGPTTELKIVGLFYVSELTSMMVFFDADS